MKEQRAQKQIIKEVQDMINLLGREIERNQSHIQVAKRRITVARVEIENSEAEIESRIATGQELAEKLATWTAKKSELEKI